MPGPFSLHTAASSLSSQRKSQSSSRSGRRTRLCTRSSNGPLPFLSGAWIRNRHHNHHHHHHHHHHQPLQVKLIHHNLDQLAYPSRSGDVSLILHLTGPPTDHAVVPFRLLHKTSPSLVPRRWWPWHWHWSVPQSQQMFNRHLVPTSCLFSIYQNLQNLQVDLLQKHDKSDPPVPQLCPWDPGRLYWLLWCAHARPPVDSKALVIAMAGGWKSIWMVCCATLRIS